MREGHVDMRQEIARSLAESYAAMPEVQAVALGGSLADGLADERSDVDLYVYGNGPLPLEPRATLARAHADLPEVGNDFWEPGDEWIERDSGVHVDVIYRSTAWVGDQLDRVLLRHEASVGYSTCIWHNLRSSRILVDRAGWLRGLQREAETPYPEELVAAIVAKNHPILRTSASSYRYQLQSACSRGDWVSVNHRSAAVLASYFDILFAVNRVLHPGEKRLLERARRSCPHRPLGMEAHVGELVRAAGSGSDVLPALDQLVDGLDLHLRDLGWLPIPASPGRR